ncbi:MAG TPA: hypothetical protein VGK74_18055, partial [Symbiobacteriaceae bacterium]
MQRLYYARTRTDNCTGATATEHKIEGPNRIWAAVPDERVSDVSHPEGATDGLSGSPLRTSDLPAGPSAAPSGPEAKTVPATNTAPASTPAEPGPFMPGLLLLIGAAVWFWTTRRRKGTDQGMINTVEQKPDTLPPASDSKQTPATVVEMKRREPSLPLPPDATGQPTPVVKVE